MNNVKTGLKDLDKLLGSGFPEKTVLLVSGDAGSGKTLFSLNFLIEGAKAGKRCCYVSLNETEEELLRACKAIESLKDYDNYINNNLVFKHILLDEKSGLEEFTNTFVIYPDIDQLVIDNLNKLLMHASDSKEYRLKLAELIRYLKEKTNCSLLLCETKGDDIDSGNGEAFEADGIIKLSFLELEEKPKRVLQVYKLRYSSFDPRVVHEFVIDNKGIRLTKTKVI
jgi:circadian clock protein KaiC